MEPIDPAKLPSDSIGAYGMAESIIAKNEIRAAEIGITATASPKILTNLGKRNTAPPKSRVLKSLARFQNMAAMEKNIAAEIVKVKIKQIMDRTRSNESRDLNMVKYPVLPRSPDTNK